jgi:hypothetical protein
MAKTKYLVAGALIVGALAATPLVISSMVDKEIENTKVLLEKNGFKQEIKSKSGYFSALRTFSLEVVDASKARNYLLDILVEKNEQYKIFAQSMKEIEASEINGAFNGLSFRGEMQNSNLFPADSHMSLILDRLPHSIQAELTKDKEASSIVLPLLTRGVFALDMSFDTRQKLKSLKVRDMKESISSDGTVLDIDTADQTLALSEEGGVVKGLVGVKRQNIGVNSEAFSLKSQLSDVLYDFNFKDDFNNKGKLDIGKYTLEVKEIGTKTQFAMGAFKANSILEEVGKSLGLKVDYTLNDVTFSDDYDTIALQKFVAMMKFSGVSTDKIKTLRNHYNALLLNSNTPTDEVLIADFVGLVNDGIMIDLNFAAQGLKAQTPLRDVSIETKIEIPKNAYNDTQSPLALVGLIDISAKVKIHKEDRAMLESLQITVPEDFALGRAEGDFFLYDITMKKGVVSVNGKPIG